MPPLPRGNCTSEVLGRRTANLFVLRCIRLPSLEPDKTGFEITTRIELFFKIGDDLYILALNTKAEERENRDSAHFRHATARKVKTVDVYSRVEKCMLPTCVVLAVRRWASLSFHMFLFSLKINFATVPVALAHSVGTK
jgi:hypothetical protein